MGSLHRAQILLEPEQHAALTDIAQKEGRSLSDLVREIVTHYLDQQDQEARLKQELEALDALTRMRQQLQAGPGPCPSDLLEQVRAERDQEAEQIWKEQA